jgi:hypothetical protein
MTPTGAWDESCVSLAANICTPSERMATHGECTTGGPLERFDSACTAAVCLDPAYGSCCTSSWTSSCTAVANTRCVGGRERFDQLGNRYGFCNVQIPIGFN